MSADRIHLGALMIMPEFIRLTAQDIHPAIIRCARTIYRAPPIAVTDQLWLFHAGVGVEAERSAARGPRAVDGLAEHLENVFIS